MRGKCDENVTPRKASGCLSETKVKNGWEWQERQRMLLRRLGKHVLDSDRHTGCTDDCQ